MKRLFISLMAASMLTACVTNPETGQRGISKTGGGAVIGAGTGALLGVLIGGNDKRAAAIGAAVGGLAGAGVGRYMDQQERKLREQTAGTGIEVVRQGDQIQLALPADISFPSGRSDIQPQFYSPLNDVASTLIEFPSTAVDIIGHADSQGPEASNQTLSERRAQSVQAYLSNQGVRPVRLASIGFGETRPIATNETAEGRARNRRVEIILTPITEDGVVTG
jgi:outer membrane protein OmpA-like peptidoglycan-associated protein